MVTDSVQYFRSGCDQAVTNRAELVDVEEGACRGQHRRHVVGAPLLGLAPSTLNPTPVRRRMQRQRSTNAALGNAHALAAQLAGGVSFTTLKVLSSFGLGIAVPVPVQ